MWSNHFKYQTNNFSGSINKKKIFLGSKVQLKMSSIMYRGLRKIAGCQVWNLLDANIDFSDSYIAKLVIGMASTASCTNSCIDRNL